MWFKRKFREWVITWSVLSDRWVVPAQVWVDIDEGRYEVALDQLAEAEKLWPGDPEITRARSLIISLMGAVD